MKTSDRETRNTDLAATTSDGLGLVAELLALSMAEETCAQQLGRLADRLAMDVAVVVYAPDPEHDRFSVAIHGDVEDWPSFSLAGNKTILGAVLSDGNPVILLSDAEVQYPEDMLVKRAHAQCALGIPVQNGQGALVLLGRTPLAELPCSLEILNVVAHHLVTRLETKTAFDRLADATNELVACRKELACVHGVAEAVSNLEDIGAICRRLTDLLPPAWTYPDKACARILIDDAVYQSDGFVCSPWGQSAAIVAGGRTRGMVQVFYQAEVPSFDGGGPFVPGERRLLDTVARTLGETVERREAEARIRAHSASLTVERNRLEAVLRGMGEGVVVTDSDGLVLLMNTAAQELLGPFDMEPTGVPFLKLIDDSEFRGVWRDTEARRQDFAKQELKVSVPAARSLSATRTQVPDLHDGRAGHVTILHDVTAEREIDQMKTDFASAVSHELRTPLTSIKGFAVTLRGKSDIDPALREHFLDIINEEADRLVILIEDLLVMSRIESGRMILEYEPVDVAAILNDIVERMAPDMLRKGIACSVDLAPDLAQPWGDREKIRVILVNLLQNAVKFTPSGGKVTLQASHDANEVRVDVRDTGFGIPEQEQQRIFERFYRVRRPGLQEAGTGLGLFIAREMVSLHGGHLEVTSKVGEGSTFSVYLPLDDKELPEDVTDDDQNTNGR